MAKNHYIPQLIIRRFSPAITTFNTRHRQLVKERKSERTFQKEDIYTDEIERKMCESLEGPFAKLIDNKILGQEIITLTRLELYQIKRYLLMDSIRCYSADDFIRAMRNFSDNTIRYFQLGGAMPSDKNAENLPSIFTKQEDSHTLQMQAMQVYLDCEDLIEMIKHPLITKEVYAWAQVALEAYIVFWDCADEQEFVLTDFGMISEYEPSHMVFEGMSISKFSYCHYKLMQANAKKDRYRGLEYARLIATEQIMFENYSVFHLSSNRCIALINPFFRLYSGIPRIFNLLDDRGGTEKTREVDFDIPEVWPSFIKTREAFRVPDNHYIIPGQTTMFDLFIYTPCKLSVYDTININVLMLTHTKELLGFNDISKVVDSLYAAQMLNAASQKDVFTHNFGENLKALFTHVKEHEYNYIFKQYKKEQLEPKYDPFRFLDQYGLMSDNDVRNNLYLIAYLLSNENEIRTMKNFAFMGDPDRRVKLFKDDFRRITGRDWIDGTKWKYKMKIEDYLLVDASKRHWIYQFSQNAFEVQDYRELKPIITLLKTKLAFNYPIHPIDDFQTSDPFTSEKDGYAVSPIISLSEDDLKIIENAVLYGYSDNSYINGYLCDILGIALKSSDYLARAAEHFNWFAWTNAIKHQKNWERIYYPMLRAMFLAIMSKKHEVVDMVFSSVFCDKAYKGENWEFTLKCKIASIVVAKYPKQLENIYLYCEEHYLSSKFRHWELARAVYFYYKSKKDSSKKLEWLKHWTEAVIDFNENDWLPNHYDLLDDLISEYENCEDSASADTLRFKRDEYQKRITGRMKFPKIPLFSDNEMQEIKIEQLRFTEEIKALNSTIQLLRFFAYFAPTSIDSITDFTKCADGPLMQLFSEAATDENGVIIFHSGRASEGEKKEYAIMKAYRWYTSFKLVQYGQPFVNIYNKNDNALENDLTNILAHNLFSNPASSERIKSIIHEGLNDIQKIKLCLSELLPIIEDAFRSFLQSQRIYTKLRRRGQKYDSDININDMLIGKKYAPKLTEILDKELMGELNYFLTNKYGPNIRNEYMHNAKGAKEEIDLNDVALFYYLIMVFLRGYD